MKVGSIVFYFVFVSLLVIASFSGCIGNGKYNSFKDKSGIEMAYASTSGLVYVFDHVSGDCYQIGNEKNWSYVYRDAGAGWKFVQFDIGINNNIKNNPVSFRPSALVDTDNSRYVILYTSNCMDFNSEICDESHKLRAYYENSTIEPGEYKSFTLVYKIPISSIPKEFDYWLYGAGQSDSIPFLWRLMGLSLNDTGTLNLR